MMNVRFLKAFVVYSIIWFMVFVPCVAAYNASLARPNTTTTLTPISTQRFEEFIDIFGGDEPVTALPVPTPNWTGWITVSLGVYTDAFEPVGWVAIIIIYAIPFVMLWLMQGNATLPLVLGAMMGVYIIPRLPTAYQPVAVGFIAISALAIFYSLFKERL